MNIFVFSDNTRAQTRKRPEVKWRRTWRNAPSKIQIKCLYCKPLCEKKCAPSAFSILQSNQGLSAWRPSKHTTSHQRRCNVVTLQRRCNDVITTLCVCWGRIGSLTVHKVPGEGSDANLIWVFSWLTCIRNIFSGSILNKFIAGRFRPVRVADGPITARCRFIKNASWVLRLMFLYRWCC